jgi:hypothetical protein
VFNVLQLDEHLIGLSHGGTLNKVRNKYAMYERAAATFLQKCKPLETIRLGTLSSVIHDNVYNYPLPSDYNSLLDLFPQDDRSNWDKAFRNPAGQFDREKAIRENTLSIEGDNGTKIIRINWRSRQGTTLHTMDSATANGTWSAVGTASGVQANTIFKITGSASIEFDLAASGDGIENSTMTAVNLTEEDEVADVFAWVYLPSTTGVTSISARWGNDLTANYWSSTAQTTQADGTAFKAGWNLIKFPWSTATEAGTVNPASIDSFRITFAATAQNNIRVDNIIFSIGRNFDIKYYSKYLFKNSAGAYISQPTTDSDTVLIDNDSLPIFLMELLKAMAHQVEGEDSAFDLEYAQAELNALYPAFKAEHPDQRVKQVGRYSAGPRWRFRRN